MDSLFEKITLYDFLGYAVPGCVCLLMLLAEWILTMPLETLEHLEAFGVGLGLIFLLLGYVLGVFLSQVSGLYLTRLSISGNCCVKRSGRKGQNGT